MNYLSLEQLDSFLKENNLVVNRKVSEKNESIYLATQMIVNEIGLGTDNDIKDYGNELLIKTCESQAYYILKNFNEIKTGEKMNAYTNENISQGFLNVGKTKSCIDFNRT